MKSFWFFYFWWIGLMIVVEIGLYLFMNQHLNIGGFAAGSMFFWGWQGYTGTIISGVKK